MRTVTVPDRQAVERNERFAYAEMERQARRTCARVPREELVSAFDGPPGELSDNDIALLYAETVKINPIPLQRAAYDGCIDGLKRQRP